MLRIAKFVGIFAIAATSATTLSAQANTSLLKPYSFGISGGASIPTGDLSSGSNTGYNITGSLAFGAPALPVGLRFDVGYNSFGVKNNTTQNAGVDNANTRLIPITANLVLPIPVAGSGFRPYLIGGAGMYNTRISATSNNNGVSYTASQSENDFGFNLGGGLTIPLTGFNAFVEARYNRVSIGNNLGGGTATFVPITFGVMF